MGTRECRDSDCERGGSVVEGEVSRGVVSLVDSTLDRGTKRQDEGGLLLEGKGQHDGE